MALTIELPPDKEQRLREAAAQAGLTPEEYALSALDDRLATASAIREEPWITGEEYAAEWARLRAAGCGPTSEGFQALRRRVQARDRAIWERHGERLMRLHRGKWAAIHPSGEAVLAESEREARRRGAERFGRANYCLRKLDDPPGHVLYSPLPAP